jgi:hypothetical protein
MLPIGPSRHFAAKQRSGRFRREADIDWQAMAVVSVENDPKLTSGSSFNYLIGDGKHCRRHLDAERSCRLQIDRSCI